MAITSATPPRRASGSDSGHDRSKSAGGWYKTSNDFVKNYGAMMGVYAVAVYFCLKGYDRGRGAWPSNATIAQELGTSKPTIIKAKRRLESLGFISVDPAWDGAGSTHFLVHDEPTGKGDLPANGVYSPGKRGLPHGVNGVYPKKTKEKKTNEEDSPLPPTGESAGGIETGFNTFWAAYPKKKAKGAARKAWKKLNPSSELRAKLMAAVERQKRSNDWIKDSGRYIPFPAKWLNDECWEDSEGTGGAQSRADHTCQYEDGRAAIARRLRNQELNRQIYAAKQAAQKAEQKSGPAQESAPATLP